MQSKSLINLYLSSLADLTTTDYKNRKQSVMAQMMLGYKFLYGLGVQEKCKASVLYYEEAALETIKYVESSFGLDVVERKKLSVGPHVL